MGTQAPAPADEEQRFMDHGELSRWEWIGMAGGLLLLLALFLPWFSTGSSRNSVITSAGIGPEESANAFQVFGTLLPILFLLLAAAPFILSWIVVRGHQLDWRTGEITMVTGLAGVTLVLCNGLILGKPAPGIDISLGIGWFLALVACIVITVAGFQRQAMMGGGPRKPPGTV